MTENKCQMVGRDNKCLGFLWVERIKSNFRNIVPGLLEGRSKSGSEFSHYQGLYLCFSAVLSQPGGKIVILQ